MSIQTQRAFFLHALSLLGMLAALFSPLRATAAASYSASTYVFELNGKPVAYLSSFEGGEASGQVISQPAGPAQFPNKVLGETRYKDWTVKLDMAPEGELLNWVEASLHSNFYAAHAGIVILDPHGNEMRRATLFNAVISEISIPALDKTSREKLQLTLKLRPSYVKWQKGGARYAGLERAVNQSRMLKSNFRLEIDGLDMSRAIGVGALTVKRKLQERGEFREYEHDFAGREVSNLSVAMPEAASGGLIEWHQDFVLSGNSSDAKERKGSITLLAPDLRTPLLTIGLDHLGIYSLDYGLGGSGGDSRPTFKAGLYVEGISFDGAKP